VPSAERRTQIAEYLVVSGNSWDDRCNAQIIQFSASSAAANGRPHVSRAGRRI